MIFVKKFYIHSAIIGLFVLFNTLDVRAFQVSSVDVTPADTTVTTGETVQYSAVTTDTSGTPVDTTVAWAVLDTSIGSIDQSGLFSALSAGSTNIGRNGR